MESTCYPHKAVRAKGVSTAAAAAAAAAGVGGCSIAAECWRLAVLLLQLLEALLKVPQKLHLQTTQGCNTRVHALLACYDC
jgi:hypothetical protein